MILITNCATACRANRLCPSCAQLQLTQAHSSTLQRTTPSGALLSTSSIYAHLQRPGDRTENPVRGPATSLPAGPGAGPGETQSDSHIPRTFPRPFPPNSHALRSMEPGLGQDETGSVIRRRPPRRRVDFGDCSPPQPPISPPRARGDCERGRSCLVARTHSSFPLPGGVRRLRKRGTSSLPSRRHRPSEYAQRCNADTRSES